MSFLGKALCLLTKNDFSERCGGAGDVIHNILQMLIRESSGFPPNSPLTGRPPLMTPTSPAPGMPWGPQLSPSVAETFPNLIHLISQTNSVTLSPAPSIDSQNGKQPTRYIQVDQGSYWVSNFNPEIKVLHKIRNLKAILEAKATFEEF